MLVLSRKKNESIVINDDTTITVVEIRGDKVRLGVEAPKDPTSGRREGREASHRGSEETIPTNTTIMIPESGMKAIAWIRSKIGSLPQDNGPLIAAIVEAVAAKGLTAEDLESFKQRI